jgi:hypothetical protein
MEAAINGSAALFGHLEATTHNDDPQQMVGSTPQSLHPHYHQQLIPTSPSTLLLLPSSGSPFSPLMHYDVPSPQPTYTSTTFAPLDTLPSSSNDGDPPHQHQHQHPLAAIVITNNNSSCNTPSMEHQHHQLAAVTPSLIVTSTSTSPPPPPPSILQAVVAVGGSAKPTQPAKGSACSICYSHKVKCDGARPCAR